MENWKDIEFYEDKYSISDYGRVKSKKRKAFSEKRSPFMIKESIMKLRRDKDGYTIINLSDINCRTFKVHRLVAKAFVNQPIGKDQVNHKNGVKSDNNVQNLEWVTTSENHLHSYRVLNRVPSSLGKKLAKRISKGTKHPSVSSYNKGCRCKDCTLKNTEKNRKMREKKKQAGNA